MPLVHFGIVNADVVLEVVFDFLCGESGLIEQIQRGSVAFPVNGGDTENREKTADAGQGIDGTAKIQKEPVDPDPVVGEKQCVIVLSTVTGETAGGMGGVVQDFSKPDQQLIALFLPVQLLEQFEMLDINGDEAPAPFRRMDEAVLHKGEKSGFGRLIRHLTEQMLGRRGRGMVPAQFAAPDILHIIKIVIDDIIFRP